MSGSITHDEIAFALLRYQWAKRAETEVETSTIINRRNSKSPLPLC